MGAGEFLHAREGFLVEMEVEAEGFGDGFVGDVVVAVRSGYVSLLSVSYYCCIVKG